MSETLTCPLCGQTERFTLVHHLRTAHRIEPETFQTRFAGHALHSAEFAAFVKEQGVQRHEDMLHLQLDVVGVRMTARFGVNHPLIPQSDPTFIWTEACKDVAEAVEHNERVFIYGCPSRKLYPACFALEEQGSSSTTPWTQPTQATDFGWTRR